MLKSIYVLLVLVVSACASNDKTIVDFSSDVVVQEDEKSLSIKKGEAYTLNDKPVFLKNDKLVPVIILPIPDDTEKVSIDLSVLDQIYDEKVKTDFEDVDAAITNAMSGLVVVYSMMHKRDFEGAMTTLENIDNANKITYLNLVRSSIYFSMGNIDKAKFHFSLVADKFPNDKNVIAFKRVLGYE